MYQVIFKSFLSLIFLMLPHITWADDKVVTPNVDIGLYINRIQSISPKNGSFTADLSIWFRWKGDQITPNKTFRLKNAKIEFKRDAYVAKMSDGVTNYAYMEIVATFTTPWDIEHFPFGEQVLKIEIEEDATDVDEIRYRADTANMTVNPNIEIQGWKVGGVKDWVSETRYNSNFGDISTANRNQTLYTQFNYEVTIKPKSNYIGLKLFVTPVVCMLILCFVLVLPAKETPRFILCSATIFALVTTHYLIVTQLPNSEQISFAEKFVLVALMQSLVYLIGTIIAWRALDAGDALRSKKYDRIVLGVLVAADICLSAYTLNVYFV
jgi:hypothetical protein